MPRELSGPSNHEERPEDAARRFAGECVALSQELEKVKLDRFAARLCVWILAAGLIAESILWIVIGNG